MLAVQEANFLYSFTLSAFSALATFLSSHEHTRASTFLFILSGIYSVYGISVAVWMYGRKTLPQKPQTTDEESNLENLLGSKR